MDIDINEIVKEVINRYKYLGSVFASIEIVPDYNCYEYHGNPSMAASKTKIFYHPDFLTSLNREHQIFTFAHEASHILLKHMERAKERDPELWNNAADAVINAKLKKDNFEFLEGCVDEPDAINYSTEQYYQKLLKEKQNKGDNGSFSNRNSGGNSGNRGSNSNSETEDYKEYDVGFDTHANWYTDEKELEESKTEDSNSNNQENSNSDNKNTENKSKNDQDRNNEKNNPNDTKAFKENRELEKKRLENLRKNIIKRMLVGQDTNSNTLNLGPVGEKTDLVKWQRLLMETTKMKADWSFLNATIEYGVVTPHPEKQPIPETEILIDTSGSVSDTLVRNFLRELKSLLQTSKIRVGCFDTKFYGFQDITNEEDIDNFEIVGRGGTNFNVAVEAFTGRAENKIIFTDGKSSMPNKELKAIWIVYGSQSINPKGGKVIYISEEQLKELDVIQRKR